MINCPLHMVTITEAYSLYNGNVWRWSQGVWYRVQEIKPAVGGFGYVVDGVWYAPDREIYVDVFSEPSKRRPI